MNVKKIGLIGLGQQGKKHLNNCLRFKDVQVVAASDLSKRALTYAKNRGVKNLYENYADLLSQKDVDIVIISLPNFLHLESTVNAAENGKDIILEKPLARSVEEGQKIKAAVDKNGVKVMMGYPLRFSPRFINLHNMIVDGSFGEVEIVDASNISNGPFSPISDTAGPSPVPSWWFDKTLTGGGVLLDLGSHLINLLTWYFGEAQDAKCYLEYKFNLEVEDLATGVIKFKNGPVALIKTGWYSHDFLLDLSVSGTALNQVVSYKKSRLGTVRSAINTKLGNHNQDSTYNALKYFINCIDDDILPEPSVDDGLLDMEVISRMYNNKRILEL